MPDIGETVTLEDMLKAREDRVERQRCLSARHGCALVSYTLNIAGPVKRFPAGNRCFYEGKRDIERIFSRNGWVIAECVLTDENTGLECIWAVSSDAFKIKASMTMIEEEHALGRLFDIDVITTNGEKISRDAVGSPERSCLVCGKPGVGCARNRTHSTEELFDRTNSMIVGYFDKKDAEFIASSAVRALLYELSASPKPGLVDRNNSGAHKDMDFFTFINSSVALLPYFMDMALAGMRHRHLAPEEVLTKLRFRGMEAEDGMFAVTGGVNTHKGAIFSLGIICAACGYLGIPTTGAEDILDIAARIGAPALNGDLKDVTQHNAITNGEGIFARYGISGVRGEVAAGFPSVKHWGLPVMLNAVKSGASLNDAGVETLMYLMAKISDTNIISRAGVDALADIQGRIGEFLQGQPDNAAVIKYATELDPWFIDKNISPGGCADLLAVTYMIYFIIT